MPALVCGNTAVIKPATDTPHSALNLIKVLEEAGIPRGVVNLVTGSGTDVGLPLIRHKDVKLVSFTGSTEVGRTIVRECAPSFKHHHLEMGGKNIIIVMDDAKLDLAVDGAIWGGSEPQASDVRPRAVSSCTRRFIRNSSKSSRAGRKAFAWGTASMARPKWGRSSAKIDSGRSKNTSGSARMKAPDSCAGATGSPTASMPRVSSMSRPFCRCRSPDAHCPGRNLWSGRLGYSLHRPRKRDRDRKRRDLRSVFRHLHPGHQCRVPGHAGYEYGYLLRQRLHHRRRGPSSFGGTKQTGNGHREAGQAALDTFSEWKAIYIDYSGKLQRAQIDTEAV